jgi:putative DNA primase/helicase
VTTALVNNVINATASLPGVLVPSHLERMTWLPDRTRRRYVSMQNGLIDLDAVLEDRPEDECILPHSPDWFSTVSLPYSFDKNAKCPLWHAFLQRNLEGDQEVIDLLQEWAGYLLTPDTGQQKFLLLEGEGGNGKGVYSAGLIGMLGMENCSFVPLEAFGDRFSKTTTLGRLLNVSADSGELDKVAEGFLKSFTSGDPMTFDRKGISAIEARPTARMMICCNQRPRFSDRSDGVWRRMIPVPMSVQISEDERVVNMDKSEWWEAQGELPGIFLWALRGLARLHIQGRFTNPKTVKENMEDFRSEMNPARMFLDENVEEATNSDLRSSVLYGFYKRWASEGGYRPLSDRVFFKEVKRRFKRCERKRGGTKNDRFWFYSGLRFSQDEICGESTSVGELF